MTAVLFKFQHPDGTPAVEAPFSISLRKPTFDEETEEGIVLPGTIQGITDAAGECTLEVSAGYGVYYLTMDLPGSADADGCMSGLRYKFVVPEDAAVLRVEDLIVTTPTWSRPWDEKAIALITEAKVVSQESARDAKISADKAAASATSIAGDAERAEAARDAAELSKTAAANSATSAGQSAASALDSKTAATVSQTAASNSAAAAASDAGKSAASATAAKTSETNSKTSEANSKTSETNSKTSESNSAANAAAALASKNAAGVSETAAAGSASTALTQANRAKTEADRATAATDGKQDKNVKLTSISNTVFGANTFPLFAADGSVFAESMSDEARLFNRQTTVAGMRSRLDLVKTANNTDSTLGRVVTVGDFGMGGVVGVPLPGSNAQQALPNGRFYTPGAWSGSPFTGTDGRNQGILDVATWADVSYTRQRWAPIIRSYGPARTRYSENGTWGPWIVDADLSTALTDPEALTGGLMYTTTISGFSVHKYANGQICLLGGVPNSNVIAANTNGFWDVSIPAIFSGGFPCVANASLGPSEVWDFTGACAFQLSSNSVRILVRNGAAAQYFSGLLAMWGRWK